MHEVDPVDKEFHGSLLNAARGTVHPHQLSGRPRDSKQAVPRTIKGDQEGSASRCTQGECPAFPEIVQLHVECECAPAGGMPAISQPVW